MKIISGAQTGADRGALDWAIKRNVVHGGYCPAGRRSEDGPIPIEYKLVELKSKNYAVRTEKNVVESDATVVFKNPAIKSPGSDLTVKLCSKYDKPCCVLKTIDPIDDQEQLLEWLLEVKPAILNVAGHRESRMPGIGDYVYRIFEVVNSLLQLRLQYLGHLANLRYWPQSESSPANLTVY